MSVDGVRTDPKKLIAVEQYPTLRDTPVIFRVGLLLQEVCAELCKGGWTTSCVD